MNLVISLDQSLNAAAGGAPDETISSRAARAEAAGHWAGRSLCWLLNIIDPGHCQKALEQERSGGHREEA